MTDGREEPSASYKLGNGWVILHWCANLTIILTGFTSSPLGSTRSQTGRSSSFGRLSKLQCSLFWAWPRNLRSCGRFLWRTGLRHCACASCFLPVSRGISLPTPLCQLWVDSGSLRSFPPPCFYLSHRLWDSCTLSITVGPLPRPISGSMPSPDLLSPPLWCSFPLRGSLSLVPPSAAWFPSCGTSRIDVSLPL